MPLDPPPPPSLTMISHIVTSDRASFYHPGCLGENKERGRERGGRGEKRRESGRERGAYEFVRVPFVGLTAERASGSYEIHVDILDPQINEENLLCCRDWNQEDPRATIFLEVPGLLPAEKQIPTQQMALEMLEGKYPHIYIYTPTAQRKMLLEMEAVACLSGPQQDEQLAFQML